VPYNSIKAHVFFPTFENLPKIEFFEHYYEIGFKIKVQTFLFQYQK